MVVTFFAEEGHVLFMGFVHLRILVGTVLQQAVDSGAEVAVSPRLCM